MKKVLITGANGFIGSYLSKYFSKEFEIYGTDLLQPKDESHFKKFIISDIRTLTSKIKTKEFDIIIHSAANKSIIDCEKNKNFNQEINFEATINLYNSMKKNAQFIFLSSDIVFDGKNGNYFENSKTKPINNYGKFKVQVEDMLKDKKNVSICRTALVFGNLSLNEMRKNIEIFSNSELKIQGYLPQHVFYKLKKNERIFLAQNEFCNPTSLELLSKQLKIIIKNKKTGIYHTVGGEKISKYEFGIKVARFYNLNEDLIEKIKSNEFYRPKDVSLSYELSENELGLKFDCINEMLKNIKIMEVKYEN
ncbi:MAG: SDR family oxidoreductase [Candidatus Woesearchaeota archaeon]